MRVHPLTADQRAEIIRLRGERLTYGEIGRIVGVHPNTAWKVCSNHFDDAVARAAAELRREVRLAKAESFTAKPFHPPEWS